MRSLFVGMIVLSASAAVVDTTQARTHLQRLPSYGSTQTHIGRQRPAQYNLQPTQDDVEKIDRDNHELDLPAAQGVTGAGPIPSDEEDALIRRIEQDNPQRDREIVDICPSCGGPEDAPVHRQRSPIYNGFNHQPTRYELRALRQQDVTPRQADKLDRLYQELTSTSEQILVHRPAAAP
jgi:hypothetical protein